MREYLSLPKRKFTSSSWSSWSLKTKHASLHLWAEQPAWNERTLWWKWTSAPAAQNAEKGNLWKLKLRQCLAGESISKWLLCEAASIFGPKMGNVMVPFFLSVISWLKDNSMGCFPLAAGCHNKSRTILIWVCDWHFVPKQNFSHIDAPANGACKICKLSLSNSRKEYFFQQFYSNCHCFLL